jgi:deoxyribodipyrimidine photo-lyase
LPVAISNASTGIQAIDKAIREFYDYGYLHNHVRMYLASIACNIGKSHWKLPAQWMYYHLLDGDWASNALSWQWVAGSNSNRKYYANQENINKYCHTRQKNTFLDIDYSEFDQLSVPEELRETHIPALNTPLPETKPFEMAPDLPVLIYNCYNMDPAWRSEMRANRVLLLEPSVFEKYPVSQASLNFLIALGKNIPDLKVFVGEFNDLRKQIEHPDIYFREHPLNRYEGKEDAREWMFGVKGYYSSFFGFWKRCKKELRK